MSLTVNHDGRVGERVPVPWFSCRAVRDSPSAKHSSVGKQGTRNSPPARMREAIDEAWPTTIVCTGVCTNCICDRRIRRDRSRVPSAEESQHFLFFFLCPSLPHRIIDRKTGSDASPWRVDVERDGRRRFRLEEEHLRDDDRRERIVDLRRVPIRVSASKDRRGPELQGSSIALVEVQDRRRRAGCQLTGPFRKTIRSCNNRE